MSQRKNILVTLQDVSLRDIDHGVARKITVTIGAEKRTLKINSFLPSKPARFREIERALFNAGIAHNIVSMEPSENDHYGYEFVCTINTPKI